MIANEPKIEPTILVAFGATGDLMRRKVLPALFELHQKDILPAFFKVIGFSRREWSDEQYREYLGEYFRPDDSSEDELRHFFECFHFQNGNFDSPDSFDNLKQHLDNLTDQWGVCTNKLFHLAVAPQYYENILTELERSKLTEPCSESEGWTRVVVEKPFGRDLKTAEALDDLLGKLFKEEQIYRIDHYLAKEMLQNIIAFRFSNHLLEDSWNSRAIEKIELRLLENLTVDERGAFYDDVGALRDMGQNHLLQMLALITMEQPYEYTADEIRTKRAEVLNTIKSLSKSEIKTNTHRAQYHGYQNIDGVDDNSDTETYFKITTTLERKRWHNIPIVIESGKGMPTSKKEVIVTFSHPSPCLCPPTQHYKNQVKFIMEPCESIELTFWAKKPGFGYELEEQTLKFSIDDHVKEGQYVSEYSRLLLDCIVGDQTLFVSTAEVQAMWKFIDPIIMQWKDNAVPLHKYDPGSKPNTSNE